jgi:hypothetical protein
MTANSHANKILATGLLSPASTTHTREQTTQACVENVGREASMRGTAHTRHASRQQAETAAEIYLSQITIASCDKRSSLNLTRGERAVDSRARKKGRTPGSLDERLVLLGSLTGAARVSGASQTL